MRKKGGLRSGRSGWANGLTGRSVYNGEMFRNSIALAKSSWQVLKADKELMLLPVISGLASLAVMALFIVPLFVTSLPNDGLSAVGYVLLFAMYFVLAYITIFFNAALISAAHERLEGGDPTVGSALRGAARRAGKILPWALVTATVSIILRAIEERVGFIGQIVVSIIGLAWAVVTFLVLPAIVIEGVGVRDAFRKSTGLLRNTWGENLAGQAGLGLLGFLLILPGVAVGVLAALAGGVVMVAGIAAAGVWMALVAVTMAALSGIYQTALYHYAVDGQVPSNYFDNNVMQAAFRPRRSRGGTPGIAS